MFHFPHKHVIGDFKTCPYFRWEFSGRWYFLRIVAFHWIKTASPRTFVWQGVAIMVKIIVYISKSNDQTRLTRVTSVDKTSVVVSNHMKNSIAVVLKTVWGKTAKWTGTIKWTAQIAIFMGPTWGPWTLLSGRSCGCTWPGPFTTSSSLWHCMYLKNTTYGSNSPSLIPKSINWVSRSLCVFLISFDEL